MSEVKNNLDVSEVEDRLVVICEGGVHMVEYLHRNEIFPHLVVFRPQYFREMIPYLTEKDEVLVIVKGLTDFSMNDVYTLINDIEELGQSLKSVRLVSDVWLGKIPFKYFLYHGDLCYGKMELIENGNKKEVTIDNKKIKTKKTNKKEYDNDRNTPTLVSKNALFLRYSLYNQRVKFRIYDKPKDGKISEYIDYDITVNKLLNVNLYAQQKNEETITMGVKTNDTD